MIEGIAKSVELITKELKKQENIPQLDNPYEKDIVNDLKLAKAVLEEYWEKKCLSEYVNQISNNKEMNLRVGNWE